MMKRGRKEENRKTHFHIRYILSITNHQWLVKSNFHCGNKKWLYLPLLYGLVVKIRWDQQKPYRDHSACMYKFKICIIIIYFLQGVGSVCFINDLAVVSLNFKENCKLQSDQWNWSHKFFQCNMSHNCSLYNRQNGGRHL